MRLETTNGYQERKHDQQQINQHSDATGGANGEESENVDQRTEENQRLEEDYELMSEKKEIQPYQTLLLCAEFPIVLNMIAELLNPPSSHFNTATTTTQTIQTRPSSLHPLTNLLDKDADILKENDDSSSKVSSSSTTTFNLKQQSNKQMNNSSTTVETVPPFLVRILETADPTLTFLELSAMLEITLDDVSTVSTV